MTSVLLQGLLEIEPYRLSFDRTPRLRALAETLHS
jgi:hypothetical protein